MRYLRVSHGTLAARVLRERREGEGGCRGPPAFRSGVFPTPAVLTQTKRAVGRGKREGSAGRPPFGYREVVLPPPLGLFGPIQPLAAAAPPGTSSRYTRSRCSLTWGRTDVKETPGRPPCDTAKADSRGLVRGC